MDSVRAMSRRSVKPRALESLADGGKPIDVISSSFNVGFWEWDASTDGFWVSRQARKILGLGAEGRLTKKSLLSAIHPADRGRVLRAIGVSAPECDTIEMQLRLSARGSEIRWINAQARAHRDSRGTILTIAGHVVDATELKRTETELHALRQQTTHLTRVSLLGEFSGALAHELQQPLTSMRCNALAAQRLLDTDAEHPAELRAILKDILASEARAEEIIQRMRSLLKNRRPQFKRVEVGDLVRNVLALAGSTLNERKIDVALCIEDGIPAVRGDLVELEQVLLNLLLNASQTMSANAPHDRRIEVLAALEHDAREVRISVRDAGTGIDPDHIERLFEPFFSTKDNGLGLGLAICRAIVIAHEGRLWAANNPDRGAAFHFTLPATEEA